MIILDLEELELIEEALRYRQISAASSRTERINRLLPKVRAEMERRTTIAGGDSTEVAEKAVLTNILGAMDEDVMQVGQSSNLSGFSVRSGTSGGDGSMETWAVECDGERFEILKSRAPADFDKLERGVAMAFVFAAGEGWKYGDRNDAAYVAAHNRAAKNMLNDYVTQVVLWHPLDGYDVTIADNLDIEIGDARIVEIMDVTETPEFFGLLTKGEKNS